MQDDDERWIYVVARERSDDDDDDSDDDSVLAAFRERDVAVRCARAWSSVSAARLRRVASSLLQCAEDTSDVPDALLERATRRVRENLDRGERFAQEAAARHLAYEICRFVPRDRTLTFCVVDAHSEGAVVRFPALNDVELTFEGDYSLTDGDEGQGEREGEDKECDDDDDDSDGDDDRPFD